MSPLPITLSPKQRFLGVPATAAAHSDIMASPQFQAAAAAALLEYQYRVCPVDPTVLMVSAAKLKGAQEFLNVLMNLGVPEGTAQHAPDYSLQPPEDSLDRPYQP